MIGTVIFTAANIYQKPFSNPFATMNRTTPLALLFFCCLSFCGCQPPSEPEATLDSPHSEIANTDPEKAQVEQISERPKAAVSYEVVEELADGSRRVLVEYEMAVPVEVTFEVELADGTTEARTRSEYVIETRQRELTVPAGIDLETHMSEWKSEMEANQ